MNLNGDIHLVKALLAAGAKPRYATKWLGPWTRIDANGTNPDVVAFLKECKALGVGAHLQFFWFGDSIGNAVLGGQEVKGRTLPKWWTAVRALAKTLQQASPDDVRFGVLVNLETEWNKGGIWENPTLWDQQASQAITTLKVRPEVRVVIAPGAWHDMVALVKKVPRIAAVADVWATQHLRGLVKQGGDAILNSPNDLLKRLLELRKALGPEEGIMVTDLAVSTYGGAFAKTHPFAGGRGDAAEDLQARVFEQLLDMEPDFDALGVTDLFLRGLKDQPWNPPTQGSTDFALGNYYGYAELNWGLVRQDGSKKPAYDLAIRLAKDLAKPPAPPPPAMVPKADLDRVTQERDEARLQRDVFQERLSRIRAIADE